MKSISNGLKAHLKNEVTTLCSCWQITRTDGQVFRFTDHDEDLVIDGQTFESSGGYTRTAIKNDHTMAVDNVDVTGILLDADGITDDDMRKGLYDYAEVDIFVVNWSNLAQGRLRMRTGWFGEVTVTPQGVFRAELRGLTQALTQEFGNTFSPLCRADFGDDKCKFDINSIRGTATVTEVVHARKEFRADAVTVTSSVGSSRATIKVLNSISSGSMISIYDGAQSFGVSFATTMTAANAASHIVQAVNNAAAQGLFNGSAALAGPYQANITINDPSLEGSITTSGISAGTIQVASFADRTLSGGVVTWITGANAGKSMEIKTYYGSNKQFLLWLSVPFAIEVGDTFYYHRGCDKRRETCDHAFNNIWNFRGEPDVPGVDKLTSYPDAS